MGDIMVIDEQSLAEIDADKVEQIVRLVTDAVDSLHTKRAYARAIRDFLAWYRRRGQIGLTKAVLLSYRAELAAQGMGASSINQRLSAIRRLATEAADNGAMSQAAASGIRNTPGLRQAGQRQGNWLPQEQAQRLLTAPDTNTLKGLRDRAILAVMLGCGLRRSEVAALTFAHVQQRQADDGRLRWLIVDLIGKGNKTRSVVMPDWAKAAIDAWASAAGLSAGPIFRQVDQWGHVGDDLSEIGVSWLVKDYAAALGLGKLAAHDLRRTYAKLARRGGAALEQVQYNLGHSSLKTTERYLGTALDLAHAPCDALGLKL